MRNKIASLIIAALSFMSATASFAVTIPINALPFAITGPGTYVFKNDLTYAGGYHTLPPGITVSHNFTGPVVIDLKGFTYTGAGNYAFQTVAIQVTGNTSGVTVQNGTISGFDYAFNASTVSNLVLRNLTFLRNSVGVWLTGVTGSSVKNCDFVGPASDETDGIHDNSIPGSNQYSGITFTGVDHPLFLTGIASQNPKFGTLDFSLTLTVPTTTTTTTTTALK